MTQNVVRFTKHADARLDQMGLAPADIGPVLFDAEVTYPASSRYGEGVFIAQRGELAVSYKMDQGVVVVITVLPRTQETYQRADA